MPNRIIKESICSSDSIDALALFEEVFFYRLLVNVDDYGRLDARIPILRAKLFPLKVNIRDSAIQDTLERMSEVGLIVTYEVAGKPYLAVTSWGKHQSIRNLKSKYPAPDEGGCVEVKAIASNCTQMPASVPVIQSNPNPNPNPNPIHIRADKLPTAHRFIPPTIEEVQAYCLERKNDVDPEKWMAHYGSNGWMVGRNKMQDWKKAVITWEGNSYGQKRNPAGNAGYGNGTGKGRADNSGDGDDYSQLQVIRC